MARHRREQFLAEIERVVPWAELYAMSEPHYFKQEKMRLTNWSHSLFAVGIIGMALLGLVYGDFPLVKQPVPHWAPWREAWAYACGILILASAIGLLFTRTAALASRVLLVYLLLWLLFLRIPRLAMAPSTILSWYVFGETTALLSGTWAIFASLGTQVRSLRLKFTVGENGVRLARILFGVALFLFGLAHFGYLKYTASLVPAWLPWHLGWACITGASYLAAGLGTLFRIYPRLAATLAAGMMSLFTLSIWIPRVITMPADQRQWTELLSSWTLAAGAWVIAESYRGIPWRSIGKSSRFGSNPR